jgi:hypothetical protein
MADEKLVVKDFQNITIVDPNKIIGPDGLSQERLVKHEELVMYANLEAKMVPRTKLVQGDNLSNSVTNQQIATVNFLMPGGKEFLTNEYLDQITGRDSLAGGAINQLQVVQERRSSENSDIKYYNQVVKNPSDTGLLGIKSIKIRNTRSSTPSVDMELVDPQGRALFEQGDNSPYACFFNLPYPIFFLTLKGFYGKAIRYELVLQNFTSTLNSNGNYDISLKFYSYKYSILAETQISHLLALPYMYNTTYTITPSQTTQIQQSLISNGDEFQNVTTLNSSKGFDKLKQVYSKYRELKLIPENFPDITFSQLKLKLENLQKVLTTNFGKIDMSSLSDVDEYVETVKKMQSEVFYDTKNSWYKKYIDTTNFYILKDSQDKVFLLKQEYRNSIDSKIESENNLDSIIKKYRNSLSKNKTLGDNGRLKVGKINKRTTINNKITLNIFKGEFNSEEIDDNATLFTRLKRNPTTAELLAFRNEKSLITSRIIVNDRDEQVPETTWVFEGQNEFIDLTNIMISDANEVRSIAENEITRLLQQQIEGENGLGFKPSIRNVSAVIFAHLEAFFMLMDDVHTSAWDKRYDKIRQASILDNTNSAVGTETKDNVVGGTQEKIPVYPWPQYYVEKNDDKGEKFVLTYPADSSVVSKTKAYRYDIWPEVEFVEEYLKGLSTRNEYDNTVQNVAQSSQINRISVNAFDFPTSNNSYSNKDEVSFFYEIYERVFSAAFYDRLSNVGSKNFSVYKSISDFETRNIIQSLGADNPSLQKLLKDYAFRPGNIVTFLQHISNSGLGPSWQLFIRGIYTNTLLKTETNKDWAILNTNSLSEFSKLQVSDDSTKNLQNYVSNSSSNFTNISDTFPFVNNEWLSNNVSYGNSVTNFLDANRTNTSLIYSNQLKYITNMTGEITTSQDIKSNIGYYTNYNFTTQSVGSTSSLGATVGTADSIVTNGTNYFSMVNTPYFINALNEGIENDKSGNSNPYTTAAYLFLNSLPLSTLSEKINNSGKYEDYIFATLNKFGAVHRVPYSWVLKYGSIWYRYKKYINDGVDILDSVWKDFNAVEYYDPVTSSSTKTYDIRKIDDTQSTDFKIVLKTDGGNQQTLRVGFYPKVLNNFAWFTTGLNLMTGYTNSDVSAVTKNIVQVRDIDVNTNGGVNIKTFTVTMETNQNAAFSTTNHNKILVFPSFGATETDYENLLNSGVVTSTDIYTGQSTFNGSVRMFLDDPTFGYFNTKNIVKPSYDEYLKTITVTKNEQSQVNLGLTYSKIEDIFGVFTKDILDGFETEFLNFSKRKDDFTITDSSITSDYGNFQTMFSNMMFVNQFSSLNNGDYINNLYQKQSSVKFNILNSFLKKSVILKIGNPGKFDRKLWGSFITNKVVDSYTFNPYSVDSLPTNGGATTLQGSIDSYPDAWNALRTSVGFSSIDGLSYSNNGSYITDFFVDNNIEFTQTNVNLLAPLIKVYATQKSLNSGVYTPQTFTTDLNEFYSENFSFSNDIMSLLFANISKELPTVSEVNNNNKGTVTDSNVVKIELWESFKTLNDKWIAGTDFQSRTIFQDVLFIDRACRDVGDLILVDISGLLTLLKSLNPKGRVIDLFSSLISKNQFVMMPMGSYINFWGKGNIDPNELPEQQTVYDVADTLFGTHTNVDYRASRPKIICHYAGKPSSNPDMSNNKDVRFGNDGFDFEEPTDNPLVVETQNKTDWATSNRVVGFNVDFGTRNQGMFKSMTIKQGSSLSTAESIKATVDMINGAGGVRSNSQSISLYNLYKNRSYTVDVTSIGNAMIQPTMYFNLKHTPMFNGAYQIQEVNHSIEANGVFSTTFNGVRLPVTALPIPDKQIMTINETYYKSIISELKTKRADANLQTTTTTNVTNTSKSVLSNNTLTVESDSSCIDKLDNRFNTYLSLDESVNSTISLSGVCKIIGETTTVERSRIMILATLYLTQDTEPINNLTTLNNNFGKVTLNIPYGGSLSDSFKKNYFCSKNKNGNISPFAVFSDVQTHINFINKFWVNDLNDFSLDKTSANIEIILKKILRYWPNRGLFTNDNSWIDFYSKISDKDKQFYLILIEKAINKLIEQNLLPSLSSSTLNNP